jgi:hypothetical protein
MRFKSQLLYQEQDLATGTLFASNWMRQRFPKALRPIRYKLPGCQLIPKPNRRREQSRPLLDVIRKQIEAARFTALPAGALAKACNYTLTLWQNSFASWNTRTGVEQ